MLIYDFKCEECGHSNEQMVRYSYTEVLCPRCSNRMTKLITGKFSSGDITPKPPEEFRNFTSALKKNTKGAKDFATF